MKKVTQPVLQCFFCRDHNNMYVVLKPIEIESEGVKFRSLGCPTCKKPLSALKNKLRFNLDVQIADLSRKMAQEIDFLKEQEKKLAKEIEEVTYLELEAFEEAEAKAPKKEVKEETKKAVKVVEIQRMTTLADEKYLLGEAQNASSEAFEKAMIEGLGIQKAQELAILAYQETINEKTKEILGQKG